MAAQRIVLIAKNVGWKVRGTYERPLPCEICHCNEAIDLPNQRGDEEEIGNKGAFSAVCIAGESQS